MFINLKALFLLINLDPNVMIFALLCNLDNCVFLALKHIAALIFFVLFAAIAIPVPDPHTKTPKLPLSDATFLDSFFAKSGFFKK